VGVFTVGVCESMLDLMDQMKSLQVLGVLHCLTLCVFFYCVCMCGCGCGCGCVVMCVFVCGCVC